MAGSLVSTSSTVLPLDSASSLTALDGASTSSRQSSLNSAVQSASGAYQGDVQSESALPKQSTRPQDDDGKLTDGIIDGIESPGGSSRAGLESFDSGSIEDGQAGSASFDTSELELIKNALKGLLGQTQTPMPTQQSCSRELDGPAASEPTNQDVIERLLKKIDAAKEDSRSRERISGSGSQSSLEEEGMDSKGMRQVIHAASRAAKAATNAAEKVANVVNKNSSKIDNLCNTLENTNSDELHAIEAEENAESAADAKGRDAKKQSNSAKSLLRQNTITHVILGVMFVTSIAWRYFVYNVGKSVNDTVSNPFAAITDMFATEEDVKDQEGPRLRLPFQGPEEDKKKSDPKDKKK